MRIVGHGIDMVAVPRIAAMVGNHADRFLDRCFTEAEQGYNADSRRRHEHLAARFAAKEAVMKALGTGLADGISWTEIEVTREATGEPGLVLRGRALEIAAARGIDRWFISMTHTDEHALASVIAVVEA
jgi:holo-[acyl-carrier protein] synthase